MNILYILLGGGRLAWSMAWGLGPHGLVPSWVQIPPPALSEKMFITNLFSKEEAKVWVFGVDNGRDALKELKKIWKVSLLVEPFDPKEKKNWLEKVSIFDLGIKRIESKEDVEKIVDEIVENKKIPLIVSYSHLSSLFSIKAISKKKDIKVIIFDAHADAKDSYIDELIRDLDQDWKIDEKINDSTWLRRLLEENNLEILLIGVRSLDENELNFLESKNVKIIYPWEINEKLEEVKRFSKNSKIYISLDIDVFDPSFAPSVHYPEPSGISFEDFRKIINQIEGEIVGIDLTCLKFSEENYQTEFLAIKSIFKVLSKIKS